VSALPIKNLIFDLGGVILDLSVEQTLRSFSTLSGLDLRKIEQIFRAAPEFEQYERGELDDAAFRDFVRNTYNLIVADQEIDRCWNAMLLGIPTSKLELLKKLKEKNNVYLLSNTNGIHLQYIDEVILPEVTHETLDSYFHKAYYSHRMRKRKPDAEIFEQVLDENGLRPEQTLFLDDNLQNIEAANALGIKTIHVTTPDHILAYFHG
jgi:glucose-1-phosphatase